MTKNFIAATLFFLVLSAGIICPVPAKAISFLGISGVVDVVIDPAHIAKTIYDTAKAAWRYAKEKLGEILLANLKKRLLDSLVDATLDWIQNGGDPRFITDFGGILEDSLDAAVGDTVQAIGLGDLCSNLQQSRLQFQLTRPVFSQRVSCTLDDIVGNIEDFRDDFREGGWIGYRESLKPQNNRWGQEAMAQAELIKNKDKQSALAEYEASVGGGFLAQKRCLDWIDEGADPGSPFSRYQGVEAYYFETPAGIPYNGKQARPEDSVWKCMRSQIITPGITVGKTVADAIGSDIDFLVNADDLTIYVASIVDALVNRLTSEATAGLLGVFTGEDNEGARGTTTSDCNNLGSAAARQACEANTDSVDEDLDHYDEVQNAAMDDLENSLGSLDSLQESNAELRNILTNLITCQNSAGIVYDSEIGTKITEATSRISAISNLQDTVNSIVDEVDTLREELADADTLAEKNVVEYRVNGLAREINSLILEIGALRMTIQGQLNEAKANLRTCLGTGTLPPSGPVCGNGICEYGETPTSCSTDCASAQTYQCSDNIDNADPEDTLVDENDPGCHTDGNASNSNSYDPNDNDETDPPPAAATVEVQWTSATREVDENLPGGLTTVRIMLTGPSSNTVTVDYAVTGGTAVRGPSGSGDYEMPNGQPNGTETFAVGSILREISISIWDDTIDENDETIIIELSNPGNAELGSPTIKTITIEDDDSGGPGI